MIHTLFPPTLISATEADIVHGMLLNPTFRKYLTMLAHQDAQDIVLGNPKEGESAESYLRRQAVVKGRVEVLTTLLSVEPIAATAV